MGFPGWHLECSVMSTKYLGQPFDIHGGGMENQFPHHECEIAQAEAANDAQFVRWWVHNNMVTVDGKKMGKSLHNFITLKEVFTDSETQKHERLSRKYDALAVRQLILNSHYRSTLDFSDAALTAAQSGYDKIAATVIAVRGRETSAPGGEVEKTVSDKLLQLRKKFEEAMSDDLNTAIALSVIFDLVRLANDLLDNKNTTKETFDAVGHLFRELGGEVLGIIRQSYGTAHISAAEHNRFAKVLNNFLEERRKAREAKDFKTADRIRDVFAQSDIVVIDEKDGTSRWEEK
jgi:cysteinyl-tRNA synthetase